MANKSKYDPKVTPTLILWMSRSGLTDTEMSAELKIVRRTLDNWKEKYPEVKNAMRAGKDWFDASVEQKLFQRAIGYKSTEISTVYKYLYNKKTGEAIIDPATGKHMKKITGESRNTRDIPPDNTSMIFWLKNRQPEKWNDVHKIDLKGELSTKNQFQIVDKDGNEIPGKTSSTDK